MTGRSGFTPELFTDLHDLVRNFGFASTETGSVNLASLQPREILVTIPMTFTDRRLVVYGSHADIIPAGARVFLLTPDGRENAGVARGVTAADLRGLIAHVDGVMRLNGGFEADGRRKRVPYGLSADLFRRSVDAVFGASGEWDGHHQLIPIPKSAPPEFSEVLREMFDRPEELTEMTDHFGYAYICHRRHLQELEKINLVMSRMCLKLGITNEAQLVLTPPDVIRRTYAEILTELAKNRPN